MVSYCILGKNSQKTVALGSSTWDFPHANLKGTTLYMIRTPAKHINLVAGVAALLAVAGFAPIRTAAATPRVAAPVVMHLSADNDALDFDLVNNTGYDLKKVLINPTSTDGWDEDDDILKGTVLSNGDMVHITFPPKQAAEHWDMKVVYAIDGSSHEWLNLNLTKIAKITLHYNADTNTTKADIE